MTDALKKTGRPALTIVPGGLTGGRQATSLQPPLIPEALTMMTNEDVELWKLPFDEALLGPAPTGEFVDSVRKFGILQPIILERLADETYRVAGGRRRIKAARKAGLETIPACVYETGWVNTQAVSLVENQLRSANDSAVLEALIELGKGREDGEILTIPGVTKPLLRKVRRLLNLLPALLEFVKQGRITANLGYEMCDLEQAKQEALLAIFLAKGKLTAADVYAATRAQAQEGIDELQGELFDTPGMEEGPEEVQWETAVEEALARAVAEADTPSAGLLKVIDGYIAWLNDMIRDLGDVGGRWKKARKYAVNSRSCLAKVTEDGTGEGSEGQE